MSLVIPPHCALIQTYLDCRTDLTQFLVRRTGSMSLAGDLVHDLYFKLCHLVKPVTITNRRAYLFSMAANLATDHARMENRRRKILEEEGAVIGSQYHELSPEHYVLVNAELCFVVEELAKLSERAQKVFYLSRYEDKYQAEIAAELGISITTVFKDLKLSMAVLNRARQNFAGEEWSI